MSRRRYLSAEGRRWVTFYHPDELHRFLVEDAVKSRATDIEWALHAYARIGRYRNRRNPSAGAEEAFKAVVAEVASMGHVMPVVSTATATEMAHLTGKPRGRR